MYHSLADFIRNHDTNGTVKKSIADCICKNMSRDVALDTLAEHLQKDLYDYISDSEDLDIDDGSNVRRDFTKTIRNILAEYFEPNESS